MDIQTQIEDLIENNAPDFEISKLFKQEIKTYKESLRELFEDNQGKDFLVKHTKALDDIITAMYKTVLRRTFGNYLPMRSSIPIALVALGSYGREQLCVHSDIDLLIVYEAVDGYNTQLVIEKFLYLAWDAGMKLGHRVHEIKDLYPAAMEDITIRTSMMEARNITGSPFTWHATLRELGRIRRSEPKRFILEKIEEAHQRRRKHPLSMQPNIKESVGGLRDSQLLFWIATTVYGVSNLRELSGKLFREERYREYRIALELLFRVRSALHLLSNKQQDQLILEQMPQIAQMLGFKDERRFVSKVLEAQWRINNFTQIFVKKMIRPYIEHYSIKTLKSYRVQKGVYNIEGRLFAPLGQHTHPINELLQILLNLEDKPWNFDPSFMALFTYATITHPLKKSTYVLIRKLFERTHLFCFLELFYNAGILHELLIVFRKVQRLPQFDGYHHFPVDLHSIQCVKAFENIKEPFIKELQDSLSLKEHTMLKVVTLLHDTGKGRKQDHSEIGARIIIPFMKKLGFNETDQQTASLLVRHHVLMSSIAFNENIYNEKTLYRLMSSIGTAQTLKLLYILTYSDINGVGSGTYSTFNARLLRVLYDNALEVSQNSERITDATKRMRIEKRLKNSADFNALGRTQQRKILSIESNLFFFKNSIDDILYISEKARQVKTYDYQLNENKTFNIEILRRIPLNIGYLLGNLSYLDVVSMDIFTLFDDIKYFRLEFANQPAKETLNQIRQIVEDSFNMSLSVTLKQPIIKKGEVTLDCEHSLTYAQLNVKTANQQGLIAYIMHTFDQLGINVATAKVYSTKKRANDHFLIEKKNNMCDNADQIIETLIKGNT